MCQLVSTMPLGFSGGSVLHKVDNSKHCLVQTRMIQGDCFNLLGPTSVAGLAHDTSTKAAMEPVPQC